MAFQSLGKANRSYKQGESRGLAKGSGSDLCPVGDSASKLISKAIGKGGVPYSPLIIEAGWRRKVEEDFESSMPISPGSRLGHSAAVDRGKVSKYDKI